MRSLMMAITLLAFVAGNARAGSTPAERAHARELFRSAQQHYKLAEYTQALEGFKEVYRVVEDASLLFNLAQCYRQLNMKEEAIHFYRTYLHDAPNVSNRASVEQILASLDKALRDEQAAKATPPQSTLESPEGNGMPPSTGTTTAPAPSPVVTNAPATELTATPPPRTPIYKKWWLWTAVAVVAVGAGVGLGLGLTHTPGPPSVTTQDGTFHF